MQGQLPAASDLAFWNRTKGCSRAELERARLVEKSLVRFWGQRNTVHVYRTSDWPFLHTAFGEHRSLTRGRLEKAGLLGDFQRVVKRIGNRLRAGEELTYKDVKAKKLQEMQKKWVVSYVVYMELVRGGAACHGPDRGNESTFVHRENWLPGLDWSPPTAEEAYPELARRYLAAYGPARDKDLAFWYGAGTTKAKRWLAAAGEDLTTIEIGGETHWMLRADAKELAAKPPAAGKWPVHLLYRFDPLVLGTKDKSWLIDEEHYKEVWRPSAHVEPVLLVHGRIAGTWRYDKKSRGLHVLVRPFAQLTQPIAKAAEKRAREVAGFLGTDLAAFLIE